MAKLQELADPGQAVWLDYIVREVWDQVKNVVAQVKTLGRWAK
jgi:hypothetical protein